jgi:hypothetical protein
MTQRFHGESVAKAGIQVKSTPKQHFVAEEVYPNKRAKTVVSHGSWLTRTLRVQNRTRVNNGRLTAGNLLATIGKAVPMLAQGGA